MSDMCFATEQLPAILRSKPNSILNPLLQDFKQKDLYPSNFFP